MATGYSSAKSCLVSKDNDYSDEFHRILFILREFRSVRRTYLFLDFNFDRPPVGAIISYDRHIRAIEKLPYDVVRFLRLFQAAYFLATEDYPKEADLNLELRRNFLFLLGELRNGLEDGSIAPGLRSALLLEFTLMLGPHRFHLMSRVLYYLYPPPGPFVPKEHPDAALLADAKEMYHTEFLVLALQYTAKAALSQDDFVRYYSIWEEVCERINGDWYGREDSKETVRRFSEVLSPYDKNLMHMVAQLVPWPHESKSPVESLSTTTCRLTQSDRIYQYSLFEGNF